ncbi:MAG TPA: peptidylprolyl isomerase [Phycisphaerae bacterium]|nr:peptidylprolyl isomerase [Phycisphaerae bacterium]HRR86044.1 peptidylprolyl isomerase [Phycisphaerae bacterium]
MSSLLSRSATGALILTLLLTVGADAEDTGQSNADDPASIVRADVRLDQPVLQTGQKVWATFTVTNLIDEPVGLQVPGAQLAEMPSTEVGLPLQHVFSARNFGALTIEEEDRGTVSGETVTQRPVVPVPLITLAPHACLGVRIELTQYYDILRRPGVYKLTWKPYEGVLQSEPAVLTVMAKQRAKMITNLGTITIEFYYAEAPNHVRNFVELVRQGFYDNLTFHRVIPGGIIQGGSPTGDNKGARPDGKTLKAEFSKIPFEAGTVGMARSPNNPDSASCQFFICLSAQPSFVGNQTAFAKVVGQESFETLKKIASVPTTVKDRPIEPVYIKTISLENIPERSQATSPSAPDREGAAARAVVRVQNSTRGKTSRAEGSSVVGPNPATSQPAASSDQ